MNKYAYVTMLFGDNEYFIGTLVYILSLMQTKTQYDKVLLYTDDVQDYKVTLIDYIKNDRIERKRFINIFTKLKIFTLVDYDKILFLDNDMYVQHNIDHLFNYNAPAGMAISPDLKYKDKERVEDSGVVFNAGTWLIKPSMDDYKNLVDGMSNFNTTTELEQEYVSYYFNKKWTNMSFLYNFQFSLSEYDDTRSKIYSKVNINNVFIIHYSAPTKPWNYIFNVKLQRTKERFKNYFEYYQKWFSLFNIIYMYYTRQNVYLLGDLNKEEITGQLENKLVSRGFSDDNYQIIDNSVFRLLDNIIFNKWYRFYIIKGFNTEINNKLREKIIDIDLTYHQMFVKLLSISNNVYVVGGSIRDILNNQKINDIDINFNTEYHKILKLCEDNNWPCLHLNKDSYPYLQFGKETGKTLEVFFTYHKTFMKGNIYRDYTVNYLVYDYMNNFIIDLTSFGLEDTLNKVIRITAIRKYWEKWADHDYKKPLRYFKLISKGYKPIDQKTEDFIVNYINIKFESIYIKGKQREVPNIIYYLVRYVTNGEVYDNKIVFGNSIDKLVPFLKLLGKYINPKHMRFIMSYLKTHVNQ